MLKEYIKVELFKNNGYSYTDIKTNKTTTKTCFDSHQINCLANTLANTIEMLINNSMGDK